MAISILNIEFGHKADSYSSFVFLLLAYVGSKFIMEVLHRA